MRVLGVDPGTVRTGLGLVCHENGVDTADFVATIYVRAELSLAERLREIYEHLSRVIQERKPTVLAVETCFFHKDFKAAVKLGEARALALLAAAEAQIEIVEYAPARIKMAICGNGRASKSQMQYMVRRMLKLDKDPQEDAADALSVALCHIQTTGLLSKIVH